MKPELFEEADQREGSKNLGPGWDWSAAILPAYLACHFFPFFNRTAPIHAEAPEFTDMSVEQEILVTGIKVVDLLAPYAKGGKIGW